MFTFLLLVTIFFQAPEPAKETAWPLHHSVAGEYSIAFPAKPELRTERAPSPKGAIDLPTATLQTGAVVYAITYFDVPQLSTAKVGDYLDQLREGRKSQGRIVAEKAVKIDGNPARDVDVESPKTDTTPACLHRVRFLVVKQRVYEMMVVCPLEQVDATAADATKFLDSFAPGKIAGEVAGAPVNTTSGWIDFRSDTGRFEVRLPKKPTEETQQVETGAGLASITIFQTSDDMSLFMVTYREIELVAARKAKLVFDGTRDLVVASSKGKLIGRERIINQGRASGREFRAEVPLGDDPKGAILQCRLYLSGRRLYQVVAVTPKDPPVTETTAAYFESFHIRPAR